MLTDNIIFRLLNVILFVLQSQHPLRLQQMGIVYYMFFSRPHTPIITYHHGAIVVYCLLLII